MPKNMKLKVKYVDFLQLENYQKSLINFLMKDAYVSCNGVYQGTKASYYFYESENHWMRITAKQPGEIGNTYKIKFYQWKGKLIVYTTKERDAYSDHSLFTMSSPPEIITADIINSMPSSKYAISDYFTFEGMLTFSKLQDKDVEEPEYMQLSGGSDTLALQKYYIDAVMPSSNIEIYNENLSRNLYHGEYIDSKLRYKFLITSKQSLDSTAIFELKRGSGSYIDTLFVSFANSQHSTPVEIAHKAFDSSKQTLTPEDLSLIELDNESGNTVGDLFSFVGEIPWEDIPYGDTVNSIGALIYTGERAKAHYHNTDTPTMEAYAPMAGTSYNGSRISICKGSSPNSLYFAVYKESLIGSNTVSDAPAEVSGSYLNNLYFTNNAGDTQYMFDFVRFYGHINYSDLPEYNSGNYIDFILSGGEDISINNNAYSMFEISSPYYDKTLTNDSTKLAEYNSTLRYSLESINTSQFNTDSDDIFQTNFIPYIGNKINLDSTLVPSQLSSENQYLAINFVQKNNYKYDFPLRTSSFRITASDNNTYDLYYKVGVCPVSKAASDIEDYDEFVEDFSSAFKFIYGLEKSTDHNVQFAIGSGDFQHGILDKTLLCKSFANDSTDNTYTNDTRWLSLPLLAKPYGSDVFTLLAIIYIELYSGTELFNINLNDLNITQISVYNNGEWKIAMRSNSDNLAVLDFVKDDNTGSIVPSTYYPS